MKRCPECRRDYFDDSLLFCLDDGSSLLEGPASLNEPATAVLPGGISYGDDATKQQFGPGPAFANSIAVLPFANMSADAENEYFCDGLAEELLNALSKIENLKVAARTSAFSFKGTNANVAEIAKALNVRTVLEGSVRKANDRVRVTAQLINAADGYHIWSGRYDRELKDIFDVQDEIAVSVVDSLKVKLLGEEKAAVLKHHTRNPQALELYLQGISFFTRFTPEYFRKAIESLEQAIAIDPDYAAAYASLAECYSEMSFFTGPGEWMPKARVAASKALELDETLGKAHNSLAVVMMYYDLDFEKAEAEFKRAISLDPGNAHIQMWYGWFLGLTRRFGEGLMQMKKARELDPLSPLIGFGIGAISLWSGKTDAAIEHLEREVELNPSFPIGHQYLAEAYLAKGDVASALQALGRSPAQPGDPFAMTVKALVYATAGDQDRAREILAELEVMAGQGFELSAQIAQVHIGLGDKDEAFAWLKRACDDRSLWCTWLGVDPIFSPLRADPRFRELMKRTNLAG